MIARAHLICMLALAVGDAALGMGAYFALPERVPVHWNFRGEIDRYGSPAELALVFPVIIAAVAGLLLAIGFGGRNSALERSPVAYGRMAVAVIGMLVAVHAAILLTASGMPIDMLSVGMAAVGVLWLVLGNVMGKIRRNPVMGIRTPWTLKSDVVWERTHRVGGRLMVAHGLAIVLAGLFCRPWIAFAVFIGGTIGLGVWAFVYSWRIDQELHRDNACV